jgi:hypothetical protein
MCAPVPSARITQTSSSSPSRELLKAIRSVVAEAAGTAKSAVTAATEAFERHGARDRHRCPPLDSRPARTGHP